MVQLHVHLRHRLLQMLDMAGLIGQQHVAVAPDGTQRTDFLRRTETTAQQPITHELLQPLAVQHVALAPRHIPDVPGVDQMHFKPGTADRGG